MKLWITRDKEDDYLYLFKEEPHLEGTAFYGNYVTNLDGDLFPQVTFENSPKQIEINLID